MADLGADVVSDVRRDLPELVVGENVGSQWLTSLQGISTERRVNGHLELGTLATELIDFDRDSLVVGSADRMWGFVAQRFEYDTDRIEYQIESWDLSDISST